MHCLVNKVLFLETSFASTKRPLLQFKDVEKGQKDEKKDEGFPVTDSYTLFHLILPLANMHCAMLLIGWTTSTNDTEELIHVSWPSVSA